MSRLLILAALVSVGLMACQSAPPIRTEQKLQLGLGLAQDPKRLQQAEQVLRHAQDEFVQSGDTLGQAQTAFALGELYKSKAWQALHQAPATTHYYQQAAQQYQQAARGYAQLNRPALQGTAQIGAANAWLLADQVQQACPAYDQAQALLRDPASARDPEGFAQLQRGIGFFADLGTVCQIEHQLSEFGQTVIPPAQP